MNRLLALFSICLLQALHVFSPASANAKTGKIAVVTSSDSELQSLERDEVADIFLQKKQMSDQGIKILPVFRAANSALTDDFSQELLGKSSKQLRAYWNLKVLSGRLKPPLFLQTKEELTAFLKKNPNAVGYLSASEITEDLRIVYPGN